MKRISDLSTKIEATPTFEEKEEPHKDPDLIAKKHLPQNVEVFEISGPFFFAVADRLKDLTTHLEKSPKVFILRMGKVPIIDATGMNALKEFHHHCQKGATTLILSGIRGQPEASIKKFGIDKLIGKENIFPNIDAALQHARRLI